MKNLISETIEERFPETIRGLRLDLEQIKANQSPTIFYLTFETMVWTLVFADSHIEFITWLRPIKEDQRLMAVPEVSIYKDGIIDDDHKYPNGSAWSVFDSLVIRVESHVALDVEPVGLGMPPQYYYPDGKNIFLRTIVKSKLPVDVYIAVKAHWRCSTDKVKLID